MREMSIEEQRRFEQMESDLLNLKNEQMGLLERVSLLELTSRHYEEQFDAT